jgi:transketolase C-terminal domain/subunit
MSEEDISKSKNILDHYKSISDIIDNNVSAEEHNFLQVFGKSVSKVLVPKKLSPLEFVATNNTFSESANCTKSKHKYALDIDGVSEKTLKILYRKYIV